MKRLLCGALVVFISLSVYAQEKPPLIEAGGGPLVVAATVGTTPPTLKQEHAFDLKSRIQALEIAQLRVEIAKRDFQLAQQQAAQAEAATNDLIKQLKVEGYSLNLDKFPYVYVKSPPEKK